MLRRLLHSRRTDPATELVPEAGFPALICIRYTRRGTGGEARPFDATHDHAFQRMMAAGGDPASLANKRRVVDAVLAGEPPTAVASDRDGGTSVRIALWQMKS